jgi:Transposase, Mutator family
MRFLASQSLSLEQYRTAPIADEEVELLLRDGITERVRELGIERKILLCALGMTPTGKKRILGFRLMDAEDTVSWKALLVELKACGLTGKHLQLITVDGCPRLLTALAEICPFQKVQCCPRSPAVQRGGKARAPSARAGDGGRQGVLCCSLPDGSDPALDAGAGRSRPNERCVAWRRTSTTCCTTMADVIGVCYLRSSVRSG